MNIGKFEKNLTAERPVVENESFLEGERLLNRLNILMKESKEGGNFNEKMSVPLENEMLRVVEMFSNKIMTETEVDEIRRAAQMLTKLLSYNCFGCGDIALAQITKLQQDIAWADWGADQKNKDSGPGQLDSTSRVNLLYEEIFKFYGLNSQYMVEAWRKGVFPNKEEVGSENSLSEDGQKDLVRLNLRALRDLEWDRPGAAATLQKDFGLANFGRYPAGLLVEQYDQRDNHELPYGAVISAQYDYNGSSFHNSYLNDLWENIRDTSLIRITETGGRFSLIRDLVKLDKRYGEKQKISFAIFSGHGNKEVFALGDSSQDGQSAYVDISDVQKASWLGRLRAFFTPQATLILDSCLTGQKQGFAQEVARKLKMEVLANDTAGGINEIRVVEKDGCLKFKVIFNSDRPTLRHKIFKDTPLQRSARRYKY